jgi:hypothetical protein
MKNPRQIKELGRLTDRNLPIEIIGEFSRLPNFSRPAFSRFGSCCVLPFLPGSALQPARVSKRNPIPPKLSRAFWLLEVALIGGHFAFPDIPHHVGQVMFWGRYRRSCLFGHWHGLGPLIAFSPRPFIGACPESLSNSRPRSVCVECKKAPPSVQTAGPSR